MFRSRVSPGGSPGGSRFGLLLSVLVVAAGIYLLTVYVPPYWAYLSLQDVVRVAADTAAVKRDEERAKADILKAAKEQDLELTEDDIEVITRETDVLVRVSWSVPIALPRYRHELHFTIERSSPRP